MIKLNPYLNFMGNTEEAFLFYKSILGGDFQGMMRFRDIPELPGKEKMTEKELNMLVHIALPIGENLMMATDALENMGHTLARGNNTSMSLHPDTREETDRLNNALSSGGQTTTPMDDMFWGDYWGMLTDKFGIQWMINYHEA
ncbi:MAG: VOC family protein [Maribacter sp.]|nr:VOC family protein [Maribacter sp.]